MRSKCKRLAKGSPPRLATPPPRPTPMAEYSLQPLPLSADGGGNFATRNARFRNMVCLHYGLKWISVGSNGNCFFESFVLLLHSSWPGLNAGLLRQNVVELFRTCLDSTQPLFENIAMEIECEINEELVCSNRKKMDGHRLNVMQLNAMAFGCKACTGSGQCRIFMMFASPSSFLGKMIFVSLVVVIPPFTCTRLIHHRILILYCPFMKLMPRCSPLQVYS